MAENLENLVSDINSEITEANEKIKDKKIPDFTKMDNKIVEFAEQVRALPDEEAKQYAALLETWKNQIASISEALAFVKDEIQQKISEAQSGAKAMDSYNKGQNNNNN